MIKIDFYHLKLGNVEIRTAKVKGHNLTVANIEEQWSNDVVFRIYLASEMRDPQRRLRERRKKWLR